VYNMNLFLVYLLLLLCIVFITILSIPKKPVIEHWGNSRRSPFSLPTISIPRFVTPTGMTPSGMTPSGMTPTGTTPTRMVQSTYPTPTIKEVDVFSKYTDTKPQITMSNPTFLNIDVNSLKIGDASITSDTSNSNLIIGSSNIGVDINRNTIFDKPVLIDEDVDTLAVKEYAFVNGRTHLMNEDFKLKDRLCFFDSNDTNCLLKDDVEYMYLASNYVNEAKVLMSACISKDGLQTSGSEVEAKNIALDDDQLCVSKAHTMPMLTTWASKTPDEDTTQSESVDEEAPSNACTKDDIEITTTYTYNGSDFTTSNQVRDTINASVCTDIWNSCGTQTNYNQEIRFKNKNTSDCDFEDITTNLEDSTYTCLDTQHCSSGCKKIDDITKEPIEKYFNRECYKKIFWNGGSQWNRIIDKKIQIKQNGSETYINDDKSGTVKMLGGRKTFKLEFKNDYFRFEHYRNFLTRKSDDSWKVDKEVTSFDIYVNDQNQYLLQAKNSDIMNQWLDGDGNGLKLTTQPNAVWEFLFV